METKLDVLITFYNQEKYVDRALNSVFKQKCDFNFRVLVGDDGSTDKTIEKVNAWMEKYPDRISIYQMDRKPDVKYIGGFRASQNRLNLLSKVKTPFFIFLDGDDYYTDDNKFQTQVSILECKENADCIACSHAIEAIYADGSKKVFPWQNLKEGKYELKNYWSDMYFHTDTTIVRSSFIQSVPVELVRNHFNDNLITYLILQQGLLYYIPKIMACYPQTGDGIWTSGNIVKNSIRNMYLYDLSTMINPQMKTPTDTRFMTAWKNLLKNKNKIEKKDLQVFEIEAQRTGLKWSDRWINYNEGGLAGRILLVIKTYTVVIVAYSNKVLRNIRLLFVKNREKMKK